MGGGGGGGGGGRGVNRGIYIFIYFFKSGVFNKNKIKKCMKIQNKYEKTVQLRVFPP